MHHSALDTGEGKCSRTAFPDPLANAAAFHDCAVEIYRRSLKQPDSFNEIGLARSVRADKHVERPHIIEGGVLEREQILQRDRAREHVTVILLVFQRHCSDSAECMRTYLMLDDAIFRKAKDLTGIRGTSLLVHAALEALIAREAAHRLAALGGTQPQARPIRRRRPALPRT